MSDVLQFEIGCGDRHDALQKDHGFLEPFERVKEHVLMLDGKPAVIACHLQAITELPPPFLAMAEAERDIGPTPNRDIRKASVFKKAGRGLLWGIEERVLRMDVIDGIAQCFRRDQRIGSHPEEM